EGVFLLGHDREVLSVASLSPLFPGRINPSEFLRSELAAAVAVRHASSHVTAPGHSHLEGIDSQPGLHPRADRIADDARGVGVLDRAEVQLALIRMVL